GVLDAHAVCHVGKDDADVPIRAVLDAKRVHLQHAPQVLEQAFRPRAFARVEYLAVDTDPVLGVFGNDLAHRLADHVAQAGMSRESGVGDDIAKVRRLARRTADAFDDAEAFVDGFEQRAVARLAVTQRFVDSLALGDVLDRAPHRQRPAPLVALHA